MHTRPENKHVLEPQFLMKEFQINAFSVFGHHSHQDPAEKERRVYHMNVATKKKQ